MECLGRRSKVTRDEISHCFVKKQKAYDFFFFFQAEDGIRGVERSRGLGGVYKGQQYNNLEFRRRANVLATPNIDLAFNGGTAHSHWNPLFFPAHSSSAPSHIGRDHINCF